jgi:transcriptional regulator with XRE-family HTH domain
MAIRKLFSGGIVRRLREERGLTQSALANRLSISTSYLNQIESDQRPLTAQVLVELSRVLRVDVATFSDDRADRLMGSLREALSDPLFEGVSVGPNELKLAARQAGGVAAAFVTLHSAHRRLAELYQSLDDALAVAEASGPGTSGPTAYDEVRDFFHLIGN